MSFIDVHDSLVNVTSIVRARNDARAYYGNIDSFDLMFDRQRENNIKLDVFMKIRVVQIKFTLVNLWGDSHITLSCHHMFDITYNRPNLNSGTTFTNFYDFQQNRTNL